MGERIVLGATHIDVADQEFSKGYQEGYQYFITHHQGAILTDIQVYGFLATNIYDCFHSDRHRAGYLLGWCAALHGQGHAGPTISYVVAQSVVGPQLPDNEVTA